MELLPTIAERIRPCFPELEGRALAVADAKPDKDNLPTLPIVMVALARETPVSGSSGAANLSSRSNFELSDVFVVEFWLKSERYKRSDQSESPFWTYYPFEAIRTRLLSCLFQYRGPRGERIWYRGLSIQADEYAVILTFEFEAHYNWCPDEKVVAACLPPDQQDGRVIDPNTFNVKVCVPQGLYCPDGEQGKNEPCDDCQDRLDAAAQLEQDTTP